MKESHFKYYYLGLSLIVWLALIYRAVVSPLVMDEATTFIDFAHTWDFLPGQGRWVANNHFLNSFLVAVSADWFGISEWAVRLPNILAFIVFAFYVYLWGAETKNIFTQALFPLIVFASIFYIEFFALARGYGLSLAFVLAGVYHLSKAINSLSQTQAYLSFVFLSLAIFANLNMQFVYLVAFAILFWSRRNQLRNPKTILLLVLYPVPIALTTWVSVLLKNKGALYLGTQSGFVSTLEILFYNVGFNHNFYGYATVLTLVFISLFGMLISHRKNQKKKGSAVQILFLIISGNIVLIFISHWILGVLYPVQRSVMHLYILWLVAVFLSLQFVPKPTQKVGGFLILLFFGFQVNYIFHNFSLNRNLSSDWRIEQVESSLPGMINSMSDPEITVGGSFFHKRQWAFQELKLKPSFPSQLQTRVENDTLADYLLSATADTSKHLKYGVYKTDNLSGISLLKRKKKLNKNIFARLEPDGFETNDSAHAIFSNFGIPTMGKQIGMRLEFDLNTKPDVLKSAVVIHLWNDNEFNVWELIRLDHLYDNLNSKRIVVNFLVPSQDEKEMTANVSFLNFDRNKYEMTNVTCYFYNLE